MFSSNLASSRSQAKGKIQAFPVILKLLSHLEPNQNGYLLLNLLTAWPKESDSSLRGMRRTKGGERCGREVLGSVFHDSMYFHKRRKHAVAIIAVTSFLLCWARWKPWLIFKTDTYFSRTSDHNNSLNNSFFTLKGQQVSSHKESDKASSCCINIKYK